MTNETAAAAIDKFVGLKQDIYSFLVDKNSEHIKPKGVNSNVAAAISHNEYKDILLKNKCIRHSV